ncbi:hypothetical protein PVK06_030765 [Gossypium arboreum]|uniref:Uncharacterized protein n=1 Tax=Gossypium arboreum TaxID=29729 RepID=A0ABR0NRI4_GOSAR|nr:hypothetical protein PVK06_030765 [Gossypium arboreum]
MEEVLRFLTKGKEVWRYQTGTKIPETFNQVLITPRKIMDEVRMFKNLVHSRTLRY